MSFSAMGGGDDYFQQDLEWFSRCYEPTPEKNGVSLKFSELQVLKMQLFYVREARYPIVKHGILANQFPIFQNDV